MRVLWLSHTADVGGAELALAEGVTALQSRGHEVHVVLPREGPLQERLNGAAGVHVVPLNRWAARHLPLARGLRWNLYNLVRAAPRLAALARSLDIDVVLTNTVTTPAGALAARRARIPHVWFLHEFGVEDHQLRFLLGPALTLKLVGRLSSQVLVNSEALRRHAGRHIPEARLRVVRYAVDIARPREAPPGAPPLAPALRLVLVGAKAPGKGQTDALRALGLLRKQGLDVSLELVGGGEPGYEAALRLLCAELELGGHVTLIPFEPNPAARYLAADVVLMCSRNEALGRVTIEAMKLGKPVIGAAAGATPELIRDGETGLLYAPGRPEELAARIQELYSDRARARAMGQAATLWATATFCCESYGLGLEGALVAARQR